MWLSLGFIADSLSGDGNIDLNADLDQFDLNQNGIIDADDCPFPDGSIEAKLWWRNIMEPSVQQNIPQEMIDQYGDSVVGVYKGKPLVPGNIGPGQGDMDFLIDKIRVVHGLSYLSAKKVAWKVFSYKYG